MVKKYTKGYRFHLNAVRVKKDSLVGSYLKVTLRRVKRGHGWSPVKTAELDLWVRWSRHGLELFDGTPGKKGCTVLHLEDAVALRERFADVLHQALTETGHLTDAPTAGVRDEPDGVVHPVALGHGRGSLEVLRRIA